MPTLCSKAQDDLLDVLDLGRVGIGLRDMLWRTRGAVGDGDSRRSLFCDISPFTTFHAGLVAAPAWNSCDGFAGLDPAPFHRPEE